MKSVDRSDRFEECARTFCAVLEDDFGTGEGALRAVRDVLLALYTAGLNLALPSDPDEDLPEDEERIRQHRKQIVHRVQAAGFQDAFWVMFHPLNLQQPEAVMTSLSDCLADIWGDLKPGLKALDADRERHLRGVLWEWSFGFQTHWGRHAIDALRALHFQLEDTT